MKGVVVVRYFTLNDGVAGSNPARIVYYSVAQLVEHDRSTFFTLS